MYNIIEYYVSFNTTTQLQLYVFIPIYISLLFKTIRTFLSLISILNIIA